MAKTRAKKTQPVSRSKRATRTPASRAKARKSRAPAGSRAQTARPSTRVAARTRTAASGIGVRRHHMDYTSHALEDVKRFYTELLGFRDFEYDARMQSLSVRTGASSSVGFMPPTPGPPEQWRPPREPAIVLEVSDVDRAHRDLAARGVTFLQPPTDMPGRHRVAILRDPEGRTIMLAQPIAP
ncbi:MAG: hypothetical protein E6K80_02915 [Candidatus Eisenbacteria bacterium]|uniref:VOC domain-containing protein n=1 Tax=Eiseniibacteriota bacterium TaxID=2212470 RepID=A0A538U910_UNCEI|nr:MAG: hypothetical protein E6K80_02915 [Candidatus Eisenbacteria bacterium]